MVNGDGGAVKKEHFWTYIKRFSIIVFFLLKCFFLWHFDQIKTKYLALWFDHQMYLAVAEAMDELDLPENQSHLLLTHIFLYWFTETGLKMSRLDEKFNAPSCVQNINHFISTIWNDVWEFESKNEWMNLHCWLVQFVDLAALERHYSQVHVHLSVDVDDQLDNLAHNEMELVVAQQLVVFDTHENSFQVFPCYQLSIALYLCSIAVALVVSLLAVDQLDLAVLVFAKNKIISN